MTEKNEHIGEISNESREDGQEGKTGKKSRGSRFRGVSRNGNQWQVIRKLIL